MSASVRRNSPLCAKRSRLLCSRKELGPACELLLDFGCAGRADTGAASHGSFQIKDVANVFGEGLVDGAQLRKLQVIQRLLFAFGKGNNLPDQMVRFRKGNAFADQII